MNRGDRVAPDPGNVPDPAAIERAIREGMRDLSQLRGTIGSAVEDQGETQRDIQNLIREMQRIDPKRFAGNPELVEQLRSQVLAGLEQLELQLRRQLDNQQGGTARTGTPQRVPSGYADAVAEYFRKLSKGR
jgi:hypothetical protein